MHFHGRGGFYILGEAKRDHENAKQLIQNTEISTASDFLSLTLSTLGKVPESGALAPWKIFCPSAEEASSDPVSMACEI